MALRGHNADAIAKLGCESNRHMRPARLEFTGSRLRDVPPVEHISQFLAREVDAGTLHPRPLALAGCLPSTIPATWAVTIAFTMSRATSRRHPRPETCRNDPLTRPLFLLRRGWPDAVLRSPGERADGGDRASPYGGGGRSECHRHRLSLLHGEYGRCHQSRRHGRKNDRYRPGGTGGPQLSSHIRECEPFFSRTHFSREMNRGHSGLSETSSRYGRKRDPTQPGPATTSNAMTWCTRSMSRTTTPWKRPCRLQAAPGGKRHTSRRSASDEDEEILRRELAMGAQHAAHCSPT